MDGTLTSQTGVHTFLLASSLTTIAICFFRGISGLKEHLGICFPFRPPLCRMK